MYETTEMITNTIKQIRFTKNYNPFHIQEYIAIVHRADVLYKSYTNSAIYLSRSHKIK